MVNLARHVIPCDPREWKFIETPVGNCVDAHAARDAEKQLRAAFEGPGWSVAFRVRGGGSVQTDLDGIHTIIGFDGYGPEFQVVLMDASEVKAAAPMRWRNGRAEVDMGTFYMARRLEDEPAADRARYRVEERNEGRLVKSFVCRVRLTEAAAAKPSDVLKVEEWCRLGIKPHPPNGGTIDADLDYVRKE